MKIRIHYYLPLYIQNKMTCPVKKIYKAKLFSFFFLYFFFFCYLNEKYIGWTKFVEVDRRSYSYSHIIVELKSTIYLSMLY